MSRRIGAPLAVLGLAALLLAGCAAPAAPAAAPESPSPAPSVEPSPEPSPEPEPSRPLAALDVGCGDVIDLALLEAAAGAALEPGGELWPDGDDAFVQAEFAYAGGFWCNWTDPARGRVVATAALVPDGTEAQLRVYRELAEYVDSEPTTETRELAVSCNGGYCTAAGFVGDHFAKVTIYDDDGPRAQDAPELVAIGEALRTRIESAGVARPLPPLSTDVPSDCAEGFGAELSAAFEGEPVELGPGYAYEESNGADTALLTAGGFACRYHVGESGSGPVYVLPDASGALVGAEAILARERVEVPSADDAAAYLRCSSADADGSYAYGNGSCDIDLAVGGAWVRASASGLSDTEAELRERVAALAEAVAAGLS